jgi:type II secretion system protein H
MAKTNFRENKGFTMVELAMLLAIIAVMAAVAIPVLTSSMRSTQLSSDARKIASAMSYARMTAAAQMTRYQLSFDINNNRWSLLKYDRASDTFKLEQAVNELSLGIANSGIGFTGEIDKTPPETFDSSSSQNITFGPRGVPDSPGIIYLSNNDADYAVSVTLSGKVQVWKYRDDQWVCQ